MIIHVQMHGVMIQHGNILMKKLTSRQFLDSGRHVRLAGSPQLTKLSELTYYNTSCINTTQLLASYFKNNFMNPKIMPTCMYIFYWRFKIENFKYRNHVYVYVLTTHTLGKTLSPVQSSIHKRQFLYLDQCYPCRWVLLLFMTEANKY